MVPSDGSRQLQIPAHAQTSKTGGVWNVRAHPRSRRHRQTCHLAITEPTPAIGLDDVAAAEHYAAIAAPVINRRETRNKSAAALRAGPPRGWEAEGMVSVWRCSSGS